MKMWFGVRLKQIREENYLTQKRLADLSGINPQMICKYEAGDAMPSLDNFIALLKCLPKGTEQLLLGLTQENIPSNTKTIFIQTNGDTETFVICKLCGSVHAKDSK